MTETPAPYGEAKHTPGPWACVISAAGGYVKSREGTTMARVPSAGWDDEQWHNAAVIAAAPELLADLEAYHGAAEDAWLSLCKMPRTEEHQRLIESGRQNLDKTAALIRRAKGGVE